MSALRRVLSLLVVVAFCWLVAARVAFADGGFVVLVNQSNPVASLGPSQLKRVVTGGIKQWDSGAVVQLGIIPTDCPETRYLASLLDMEPRTLLTRIQEQVFKGELRRPVILRSSADCASFASASAGAICIASDHEHIPASAKAVAIR